MNILITGANGQLGQEIKKNSDDYKDFSFFFTDVENLDITNYTQIKKFIETNKIEIIINCAAYTAVDKAEIDSENCFLVNLNGPKELTKAAAKYNISLIHISTDYVFDGKNYKPYTEEDLTNPQNIYGKSKLEGEKEVLSYNKGLVIRTSWLYSSFGQNFVKTILNLAKQNNELKVIFDQVGSPTYANDLANTILNICKKINKQEKISYGLYHFADEGVCSWYDFAREILEIKKINTTVLPVKSDEFKRPASRPFYSVLDKSKIKKSFNIKIPHWKDSLKKMLEYI